MLSCGSNTVFSRTPAVPIKRRPPPRPPAAYRARRTTTAGPFISNFAPSFYPPPAASISVDSSEYKAVLATLPGVCMKNRHGAFGGGTVTLERSNLDLSKETKRALAPDLDTGGDGGNSGGIRFVGGGGGGGDDDDEYHINEFDDGEDGDDIGDALGIFRRRRDLPEVFAAGMVDAVLSEWMKTVKDLPLGLMAAYKMGLLSSAQFTRFLWFNSRPGLIRFLCRTLPEGFARDFNGKMIADPSLPHKLLLEFASSLGFSMWVHSKKGGGNRDWGKAAIGKAVASAACSLFVVWSLAPCYHYGKEFGFKWMSSIRMLPNNVFEQSYRFRAFDLQKRAACFFYKAAGLFALGAAASLAQAGLSSITKRRDKNGYRGRLAVAELAANAVGAGLSLGLYANLRYQLLCGVDRALVGYFDVMSVALCLSSAIRMLNAKVGVESFASSLSHGDYDAAFATDWLDSKRVIGSGIEVFDSISKSLSASKPRRTIKRKKMTASF